MKNPNLSLAILKKYEAVLKYSFADEIEELADFNLSEQDLGYTSEPKSKDEAIRQRDFYIKLYMELLEDFRKIKEELEGLKKK
ncbi:MAG: hypothetical protein JWQ27_263 [Ferruginibacter sp.]|nr:hypothetical protein [Ferruginibacter sp.]